MLYNEIPEEIYSLTDLISLDLAYCGLFSKLSDQVGNLKKLKHLCLNGNTIAGRIPESICELTELEWLRLKDCSMIGKIPAGLRQLPKLTLLHLSGNIFENE